MRETNAVELYRALGGGARISMPVAGDSGQTHFQLPISVSSLATAIAQLKIATALVRD